MTNLSHNSTKHQLVDLTGRLSRAGKLLGEVRDLLFGCSHELAKAGGENWNKAEALFRLAKNADVLRESVAGLLSGERTAGHEAHTLHADARQEPITAAASRSARKNKSDYPKYFVRGDLLVKTGLSRDARNEYEHVVPKKLFDAILLILTEFRTSKKQFAIEDVQKRLDCPSYQTYTVLALVKARELLHVPRRGLYTFKDAEAFPGEAAILWEELKTS